VQCSVFAELLAAFRAGHLDASMVGESGSGSAQHRRVGAAHQVVAVSGSICAFLPSWWITLAQWLFKLRDVVSSARHRGIVEGLIGIRARAGGGGITAGTWWRAGRL
jgi:hypothetical protein